MYAPYPENMMESIKKVEATRAERMATEPRRLTGKYIAPEAKHLTERVEEIHKGAYDELIEQIMQKPITEMQELYNNREIEK